MIDTIQYPDTPFPLGPSLVLLGRRGSEAHGTYLPPTEPDAIDDRDLMGACIPPARYYLGLSRWEGAEAIKGQWDVVLYELRKFVRLLEKQNPNVIGMLWLEPEDYLFVSEEGRALIENRELFRGRKLAYQSFCGYASSQLKKMEGGAFRGYMGDKRKRLVEQHGYDTKNAAHLIRLLHMGEEYLRTGEMRVRRTWDRDMLVEIKRGGWKLEQVKEYAESRFARVRDAFEQSPMPDEPDHEAVDSLTTDIVLRSLRARRQV